jgi:hypothetical protein
MESILAVLVESLLNKERLLAEPWIHLSYKNGNCCNMTRCGFRYWFGNGRSLESYFDLLKPYLSNSGTFDFVLLATRTPTEQRIVVQFTNYHAKRLSASFTSNVSADARIKAATNDKVLSFFITTEFNCQQFLEGLQKRKNEANRLRRQARREELDKLEQLVERSPEEQARLEVLRRSRDNDQARRQKNSADLATLEQLVVAGVVLNDVERVRLEDLQSAKTRHNEAGLLRYHSNSAELATLKQLDDDGEELDDKQRARLKELQRAKTRKCEAEQLRNQQKRADFATLKQLDENGEELDDVQQARLEELQSAKKRRNEANQLRNQQKRQKRACDETHPMLKLLVSSNKKCPSKLIAIITDGTLKKVLTSYFVPQQKMKFSDKFINTVDGCEGVTRFLAVRCLDNHIPDLSTMKDGISSKTPLSKDNSNHAQRIILQLFPE